MLISKKEKLQNLSVVLYMCLQIGVHIQLTHSTLTKQVVFMPYYVIVNNASYIIECQEADRPADPWVKVFFFYTLYLHCMLHYKCVILHAFLLHISAVLYISIYSVITYYPIVLFRLVTYYSILYSILYYP